MHSPQTDKLTNWIILPSIEHRQSLHLNDNFFQSWKLRPFTSTAWARREISVVMHFFPGNKKKKIFHLISLHRKGKKNFFLWCDKIRCDIILNEVEVIKGAVRKIYGESHSEQCRAMLTPLHKSSEKLSEKYLWIMIWDVFSLEINTIFDVDGVGRRHVCWLLHI